MQLILFKKSAQNTEHHSICTIFRIPGTAGISDPNFAGFYQFAAQNRTRNPLNVHLLSPRRQSPEPLMEIWLRKRIPGNPDLTIFSVPCCFPTITIDIVARIGIKKAGHISDNQMCSGTKTNTHIKPHFDRRCNLLRNYYVPLLSTIQASPAHPYKFLHHHTAVK